VSPGSNKKIRVLYVEDAFDQAMLVQAFLNTIPGCQVTHSQDGDQAARLIESEEWDLLVTDLNLPGIDGFSIIRKMRAKSKSTPILVTTGYTQAQYEEQALRAGADQVMIKPLRHNDFVARVTSMIENETVESADSGEESIIAVAGRLGDVEMGCGGTLMQARERGVRVVLVPVLMTQDEGMDAELKGFKIATSVLGLETRLDPDMIGDQLALKDHLESIVDELSPTTVYLPAPDDRDPNRRFAHRLGKQVARDAKRIFGYETATTGLEFVPAEFVDVRQEMVVKMEALAAYQSTGAPRVDLRPRMAQAYARYWGRFKEFTEVEAFEIVTDA
jgi:DNA-binding response OmpR family regulator